jgi:hypothetical protein
LEELGILYNSGKHNFAEGHAVLINARAQQQLGRFGILAPYIVDNKRGVDYQHVAFAQEVLWYFCRPVEVVEDIASIVIPLPIELE